MIAVIADDFTGAAEIGGVGLRHGLNVVIGTETIQPSNADLFVIATDTRSMPAKVAAEKIVQITEQLLCLNPEFIYKKVDSVLRGNISEELSAQMKVSGLGRTIIIAANPVFNRIIRNGIYFINNIPLNLTNFSNDPEYPVYSSIVSEIVGNYPVFTGLKPENRLPDNGLIVGDVTDFDDLDKWAGCIDKNTLPAGASGFFDVLLKKHLAGKSKNGSSVLKLGDKALYVLGSAYPKDFELLKKLENNGYYLSNMPVEIYSNKNFDPMHLNNWANDIINGLCKCGKVIASIIHTPGAESDLSLRIRENVGELIKIIVKNTELNELIIEGGSTTFSILKHLAIKKLYPLQEIDLGVIRMEIEGIPGLYLTTKPGSYIWPENFWISQNEKTINNIIN